MTPTKTMTKTAARKITNTIKENLNSLPLHIHEAMKGKAYKALGYESVKDWADTEFGLSRSRVYQLLAWKSGEHMLIEKCDLSPAWSMVEENFREFNGDKLEALVTKAEEAVEGIDDEVTRGRIVERVVSEERTASLEAKAVSKKKPPVKKVITTITAVPLSMELLRVKAMDSATVLTNIGEDEDSEAVLAKLEAVKSDLDQMIADFKAGEGK